VVKLGEYRDWTAYSAGVGAEKVCYVVSEPTAKAPPDPERAAFIYITHRPGRNAMGVPMAYAGYPYKENSRAGVDVAGKGRFTLFTHADTAWVEDDETEARMLKAMRAGQTMTFKATPMQGPETTDTYSLNGLVAALRRIGEACPER